jgi:aldose 1-epimerase
MKEPVLFQNQPASVLRLGGDEVFVSSAHGARLLRWTHEGREVVTWPENADWSHILKVRGGNPVLFPFLARHFVDGVNEKWKDRTGVVRDMPQHGFARDAVFALVEDEAENILRLRLEDSDATRVLYPFSFRFDVVFTLHPRSRLEIAFETTNLGDAPLPYYAGHHFYLAIPHAERADWMLHLPCASWARQTPTGAIIHEEPKSPTLSLGDSALVDRFQVHPLGPDVTLAHADGRRLLFELKNPGSVPWYAVTTWSQSPESDFYCVEPWLGLPNAIHHGEGLRWLEPGKSERAVCVLDAVAW